jgi:hypothetical protein
MKTNDSKKLETIYSSEVLKEGVWDQIKHKASTAAGSLAGVASNVGNRLANVVRSSEDQKNPVEAQVQTLWNNFRNNTLKAVESFLKEQSSLLDTDKKADSLFTQQLNAIKEAQKFLQDPPNYIKNNPTAASSPRAAVEGEGAAGAGSGSPESGSKDGVSSSSTATTSSARSVSPSEETAGSSGSEVASSPAPEVDRTASATPVTDVSSAAPDAKITDVPQITHQRVLDAVSKLKQENPEEYQKAKEKLEKIFAENFSFKVHFNKNEQQKPFDEVVRFINENIITTSDIKSYVKLMNKNNPEKLNNVRFVALQNLFVEANCQDYTSTEDAIISGIIAGTAKGFESLMEEEAPSSSGATAVASPPKPSEGTSADHVSTETEEDVRYHGTKPLVVEAMKFFSQFRSLCEKYILNIDKIKRVGDYGKSTANRTIFYTVDNFLKRLLQILYIPGASNLQGANPFEDKMK